MDTPDAPEVNPSIETDTPEVSEAPEAPDAPESAGASEPDKHESFTDRFDPETLDESLRGVYNDMRGDYTKKTMELAEMRKQHEADIEFLEMLRENEDAQRELLQHLAEKFEYEIDDEDEFDPDPLDELSNKVQSLEQRLTEEQIGNALATQLAEIESEHGELTEAQRKQLFEVAYALDQAKGNQIPDIRGAYAQLTGFVDLDAEKQRWKASKQAPAPPPGGQAGSHTFDITDPEGRRQHMARLMESGG